MRRFVVFGCSIAAGHGLENPSEEGWASILSKRANLELVNNGIPGASNKLICSKIEQFNYKLGDIVFIQWSMKDRYSVLIDSDNHIKIVPGNTNQKESNSYYQDLHTEYDTNFMNKVWINYAVNHLIDLDINFNQLYLNDIHKTGELSEVNKIPFFYQTFTRKYPKAPDNSHMGKEGNLAFANTIYPHLFETTDII